MFKKIVAGITVLCVVFTLCSCGADKVNYLTLLNSMVSLECSDVTGIMTIKGLGTGEDFLSEMDSVTVSYEGVVSDGNSDLTGSITYKDSEFNGHIVLVDDKVYVSKDTIKGFLESLPSDAEGATYVQAMLGVINSVYDSIKEDYIAFDASSDIKAPSNSDYTKAITALDKFISIQGKKVKSFSKSNGWYNFKLDVQDVENAKKVLASRRKMIPATIELYEALANLSPEYKEQFTEVVDELTRIQNDKDALKEKITEWKESGITELDVLYDFVKDYTIESSIKKDKNGYDFMLSLMHKTSDRDMVIEYSGTVRESDKAVKVPDSVKYWEDVDIFNMGNDDSLIENDLEVETDTPAIDEPETLENRDVTVIEHQIGKTAVLNEIDKVLNRVEIDDIMSNIAPHITGDWKDDFRTSSESFNTKSMTYSDDRLIHTIKLSISTIGYNDFDYSVSADEISDFDDCFEALCIRANEIAGLDIRGLDDVTRAVNKMASDEKVDSYVEVQVDKQRLCTIYLDAEKDTGVYMAFTYEYSYE